MGGNVGRVIVPMALAAATVYTGGLASAADVWAGPLFTAPQGFVFTGSSLGVAAAAATAGINEIGNIRREQAQRAAENARNAAEAAKLRADYEAEDRRRRLQLKQQTARLRARFAASGTGGVGGSAEAVIGGLKKVAADDHREASQTLSRRLDLLAPTSASANQNLRFLKQATKPAINLLKLVS